MSETDGVFELKTLGLAGATLKVIYDNGSGMESIYEPGFIRLGPQGVFLQWPEPPEGLREVHLEWPNNPFISGTFRCECTVVDRQPLGVEVEFDRPTAALQNWLAGVTEYMNRREPDAALRTSKLYTRATVVSACGLLCGALALLLSILIGDQWWVDTLAKFLLVLMVASIGGFAWIRILAGREEVRAIGRSRQ